MLEAYYTVKGYGETEIVIEKSRFICYVERATTEEEAVRFIHQIKKKHWDATHNCSAYIIGEHDHIQKANDDGEPSGTAGVPMLEVLKKKKLKDTVVVVTRYFGGIKLGAGGLVRAYGKAVTEGLKAAGIVERKLMRIMHTTIDYTWLGKVENELRASTYSIKDIHYAEHVTIDTYVEEKRKDEFRAWMIELTNGKSAISEGEHVYVEFDVAQ
ncbi:YigZ family protein [Anoxybacillus sp. FSL W8-0382]|uniref:YigZ family protein n=1 Tax=Anoxybacillus TaxID=150247 RepID=UPI000AFDF879|nr:YigZ family protein [Anoxybacillus flavithermus]MBE2912937.1 YigZ family protein [Anoxybacillus flavithermus]MBE2920844.1 YigZ family protein [Anoxybacillus flavithermus]MBE2932295.1 YigZ family protein [Anoxybacillus flavithermus]MBE2940830.1 YigZ family protein [Anoxybacillus flavithermus]MBE2943519.1 YigZ family protein [Anoxybacillus flavithermus]